MVGRVWKGVNVNSDVYGKWGQLRRCWDYVLQVRRWRVLAVWGCQRKNAKKDKKRQVIFCREGAHQRARQKRNVQLTLLPHGRQYRGHVHKANATPPSTEAEDHDGTWSRSRGSVGIRGLACDYERDRCRNEDEWQIQFLVVATSKFSYWYIPYYKTRSSSYEHLSPFLSRLRCESNYFLIVSNPLLTSYW